jgi:hypothetical protein
MLHRLSQKGEQAQKTRADRSQRGQQLASPPSRPSEEVGPPRVGIHRLNMSILMVIDP